MNEWRELFADAGCDGYLFAKRLDDGREVEFAADEPVALASVFKIAVALEFCRQASVGEVDPAAHVVLSSSTRTGGPTGFSVCRDDATLSSRDLAYFMMSISDNAATDALIDLVGLNRINETLSQLGLKQTTIPWNGRDALDLAAREFGFEGWSELQRAQAGELGDAAHQRATDLAVVKRSQLLQPSTSIRSTPRQIGRLLEMIWTDSAGPAEACRELRWLMSHQPKTRVAGRLPDGTRAFVKSGSLWGVVRNEAGVVDIPGIGSCVVSMFTRAHKPFEGSNEIESAIAEVSRLAVEILAS